MLLAGQSYLLKLQVTANSEGQSGMSAMAAALGIPPSQLRAEWQRRPVFVPIQLRRRQWRPFSGAGTKHVSDARLKSSAAGHRAPPGGQIPRPGYSALKLGTNKIASGAVGRRAGQAEIVNIHMRNTIGYHQLADIRSHLHSDFDPLPT